MNKITFSILICGFGLLLGLNIQAAETKTDPSRDMFIEQSATNFVLLASAPKVSGAKRLGFELSAPEAGEYTAVCFIDGKLWKTDKFSSPGTLELSTRGMPPGSYKITLQLIDSQGRVGSHTWKVQVE